MKISLKLLILVRCFMQETEISVFYSEIFKDFLKSYKINVFSYYDRSIVDLLDFLNTIKKIFDNKNIVSLNELKYFYNTKI